MVPNVYAATWATVNTAPQNVGVWVMATKCKVCGHMEAYTVNRFLVMAPGTPGKRGPRSLAPVFGLDRRDIARHERVCLVGERRQRVLTWLGGGGRKL